MPLKRCPKCGETKTLAEFSKKKTTRDGLQSYCKECDKSSRRRYYEANREAVRERNRRYYEENREAMRESQRRYREENRYAVREKDRRYKEANREAVREKDRRYREENRYAVRECNRRYYEENRDAVRERNRRYYEENHTLTAEVATRTGAAWTEAEDDYLASSNDSMSVQAVELGRTYAAVKDRRSLLRRKAKASA